MPHRPNGALPLKLGRREGGAIAGGGFFVLGLTAIAVCRTAPVSIPFLIVGGGVGALLGGGLGAVGGGAARGDPANQYIMGAATVAWATLAYVCPPLLLAL
jgi:hypothetical protein